MPVSTCPLLDASSRQTFVRQRSRPSIFHATQRKPCAKRICWSGSMNKHISLNGSDWLFKDFYGEDWRWRDAHKPNTLDTLGWRIGSVPGCPDHDLLTLGEIPDPYVDRNSLLIEWIPQRTWLYKKTFTVGNEVKGKQVQLHFEGVDYEAEFFLNGASLGKHTGMFTPATYDVTDKLRYDHENLL